MSINTFYAINDALTPYFAVIALIAAIGYAFSKNPPKAVLFFVGFFGLVAILGVLSRIIAEPGMLGLF